MSIITDTFFGGAEKDAARAQQAGIEAGIDATTAATAQARKDIGELFPQARQDLQQGFQGALDVFQSVVPQQSDFFQQGNISAQNAILAGLPQQQAAILGGQVDLSALQPSQQFTPDFGFLNQNIMPAPVVEQPDQVNTPSLGSGGNLTLAEILGAFGVSEPVINNQLTNFSVGGSSGPSIGTTTFDKIR